MHMRSYYRTMPARLQLFHCLCLCTLLFSLLPHPAIAAPFAPGAMTVTTQSALPPSPTVSDAWAALGRLFLPNRGEFDAAVQYTLRSPDGLLLFTPNAVTFAFQADAATQIPALPLQVHFVAANPQPVIEGVAPSGVRLHAYVGNDPTRWRTNLALHNAIRYHQLYPGIDLHYDTTAGLLKGTYVVAPGSDPTQIRWQYEGATSVAVKEASGDLMITLADAQPKTRLGADKETGVPLAPRTLTEKAPVAWQEINGQRVPVAVSFQIQKLTSTIGKPLLGFHLGHYDPAYPLVIDPTLEYSSALAYSATNFPAKIKTDAQGNVYIVGAYEFPAFLYSPLGQPLAPRGLACERLNGSPYACHDAFILKLDKEGHPQYLVSLGGSYNDTATSLFPDAHGNLYVAGVTHSRDFPRTTPLTPGADVAGCETNDRTRHTRISTLPGGFLGANIYRFAFLELAACAGFVTRFDANGTLAVASFLPLPNAADVNALAPDGTGNVWVAGRHAGKAFLLKMDSTLTQQLAYTDSFAGDSSQAAALQFDAQGRIWIAGTAFGPPSNPGTNAFLARLNGDGSGLALAFFGLATTGVDLALDSAGAAYLLGETSAANLQSYLDPQSTPGAMTVLQPTFAGGKDAFVAKYSPNFVKAYVTYLGGASEDEAKAIAVDTTGNAIVFGTTYSADFPTVATLQPFAFGPLGQVDLEVSTFLSQLNRFGTALVFSTFFGGEGPAIRAGFGNPNDTENADFASSLALDPDGKVWVTGYTTANPFPFLNGYATCCGGGGRNGFVARFNPVSYPVIFIPGVSGSLLVDNFNNELWLALGQSGQEKLTLYNDVPHPDLIASDAIREVALTVRGLREVLQSNERSSYGPFLGFMAAHGFREYKDSGTPVRRTPAGCDVAGQAANSPNLFVFPYDWRIDNAINAQRLRDYMLCVRMFYPDAKINIIAHSMGNYVTRRYLLENPNDHFVNALISVGAPFLGGPKLAYVLQTGDFGLEPLISNQTIKAMVGSFTAAHQIIPGRAYLELGGPPIFAESGFDLDGNGLDTEVYDYAKLTQFLDQRYGRAGFLPGTASRKFHDWDFGGRQDNWSDDSSEVKFFHIYGVGGRPDTAIQTVIKQEVRCVFRNNECIRLLYEPRAILNYGYGDQTVPVVSAERIGGSGSYNAPHAKTYLCKRLDGSDPNVEHTGMLSNPVVDDVILRFLGEANGGAPAALPSAATCGDGTLLDSAVVRPTVEQRSASNGAGYTVRIVGADNVVATDPLGNSTIPFTNTTPGRVPGIVLNTLGDRNQDLLFAPGKEYTITFLTTDEPVAIDITLADDTATTAAIRYHDLELPPNVPARLHVTGAGVEHLRYDGDHNGAFETEVPPTVAVTGAAADDTIPPTVSFSAASVGNLTEVTLNTQDTTGIQRLFYALDGTTFKVYTGTLAINPAITPLVYTFADDTVGNRSALYTFYVPNPSAPDLAVSVTTNSRLAVGDTINYQITVNNATATTTGSAILLTDTLPIGTAFVSATGTGWTCQQNSGLVACTHAGPLMGNSALPSLTITAATQMQAFPTAYNRVKVKTAGDPNPANDVAESYTEINAVTDLALHKSHSGDFSVGAIASYTITVSNRGALPALGPFTVVDTLPNGLTFVSAAGNGWQCTHQAQTITCVYNGSLGLGSLPALTLQVQVEAGALGGVTNSATVSAPNVVDTNNSNNSASDPTAVVEGANLGLFVQSDALQGEYVVPWVVGQQRSYKLYLTNNGPSTAQSPITVTGTLSPGVQFVGDTSDLWACATAEQGVTCASTQPLEAGVNASFAISVAVESNAYPAVMSTFRIDSITPDANPADNQSGDTTQVYYGADLAATLNAPRPLVQGNNDYTIQVQNLGPIDIDGPIRAVVNLASFEPGLVSIASFAGANWHCDGLPSYADCTYPAPVAINAPLPPLTLTVQTNGPVGTRIDANVQTLIANQNQIIDPNNSNNNPTLRRLVGVTNMPPTANDDFIGTPEDQAVTVNVLANDFEIDYDPMTVNAVSAGGHGLTNSDGVTVVYTPTANFNGSDAFTYTVSDGLGGIATGTVYVDVFAVNDPPSAYNDSATVAANSSITIPVLANDVDVDGEPITLTAIGAAAHGSAVSEGEAIRYTPASGYVGNDNVTYTISDPTGAQATATVNITVTGQQRPRITIQLDSQPDSVQNYRFTGSAGLPATFRLDDITPPDTDTFGNALSFTVNPGLYTVTELVPSGRYLTAITCDAPAKTTVDLPGNRVTFTVVNGDAVTCTFVNQRGVTIRTRSYNDLNHNGRRNAIEPYVNGWQITLYLTPTTTVITSGVTAVDGRVNFAYLRPGSYAVCLTPQSGFTNSDPGIVDPRYNLPCEFATLEPGKGVTMAFGNYQTNAVVEAAASTESAELASWVLWEYPDVTDDAGYDGDVLIDHDPDVLDGAVRVYLPVVSR